MPGPRNRYRGFALPSFKGLFSSPYLGKKYSGKNTGGSRENPDYSTGTNLDFEDVVMGDKYRPRYRRIFHGGYDDGGRRVDRSVQVIAHAKDDPNLVGKSNVGPREFELIREKRLQGSNVPKIKRKPISERRAQKIASRLEDQRNILGKIFGRFASLIPGPPAAEGARIYEDGGNLPEEKGGMKGIFRRIFPQENTWYNRPEDERSFRDIYKEVKDSNMSQAELLKELGWGRNRSNEQNRLYTDQELERFVAGNMRDSQDSVMERKERREQLNEDFKQGLSDAFQATKRGVQKTGDFIGKGVSRLDKSGKFRRGVANVVDKYGDLQDWKAGRQQERADNFDGDSDWGIINEFAAQNNRKRSDRIRGYADKLRSKAGGEFSEGGGIDTVDRMEAVAGREMPKLRSVADQVDFSDLEGLNDEQLGALYDMANKYTSKFGRKEGEEERGALDVISDLKDNYGNIKSDLDRVAEITGLDRDQIKDIGYDIIDANPGEKLGWGARAAARTLLYSLQYGGKVTPIKANRGSIVRGY